MMKTEHSSKKGLSPLVATVLLIAMTVSIAGVILTFTTAYTKSAAETIQNRTAEALDCTGASIEVENVFLRNGTAGNATVQVTNNGLIDSMVIVSAQLFNTTGSNFTASGLPVAGVGKGKIVVLNFAGVSSAMCSDFSYVTVSTTCPEAGDTFRGPVICVG